MLTFSLSFRECGCGEGDSGCSVCGCCRICAKENVDNSDLALLGPSGAGDLSGMMRLDLMFGSENQSERNMIYYVTEVTFRKETNESISF